MKLNEKALKSPLGPSLIVIASIFSIELIIMQIFKNQVGLPYKELIDASILTCLLVPVILRFVYKPLKLHILEYENVKVQLHKINSELEQTALDRTAELQELNRRLENRYEGALNLSEEKFKAVVENLNNGVAIISPDLRLIAYNKQLKEWFPQADIATKPYCFQNFCREPRQTRCPDCAVSKTLQDGKTHEVIKHSLSSDGQTRDFRIITSPVKDEQGNIVFIVETSEDFTDRLKYEQEIEQLNEVLEQRVLERTTELETVNKTLEQQNLELQQARDKYYSLIKHSSEAIYVYNPVTNKIVEANDRFKNLLGYKEHEVLNLKIEDIVSAEPGFIRDIIDRVLNTHEEIYDIAYYRRNNGEIVEVERGISLINYGKDKVLLVNVHDISERRQAENALRESLGNLQTTLNETVNALVAISEKKDPYISGHQDRVAQLSCAIATEMELSEEIISGIHTAAKLHDIGKINVPADILNKPGILSKLELELIKTHSLVGYDVLAQVPFKQPVSKIILQHHERLDGSGYPQNLKAEDILLEAKIIGVADVVEAMASHRPYRPAVGLDAALEEIAKNSGSLYDSKVVDTCLRLFKTKSFEFKY